MKMPPQTRREFCSQACQAVGLAAMAGALQACGGGGLTGASSVPALPRVSGSVSNGAITLTVDASSPLASVGGAALVQYRSGSFESELTIDAEGFVVDYPRLGRRLEVTG